MKGFQCMFWFVLAVTISQVFSSAMIEQPKKAIIEQPFVRTKAQVQQPIIKQQVPVPEKQLVTLKQQVAVPYDKVLTLRREVPVDRPYPVRRTVIVPLRKEVIIEEQVPYKVRKTYVLTEPVPVERKVYYKRYVPYPVERKYTLTEQYGVAQKKPLTLIQQQPQMMPRKVALRDEQIGVKQANIQQVGVQRTAVAVGKGHGEVIALAGH